MKIKNLTNIIIVAVFACGCTSSPNKTNHTVSQADRLYPAFIKPEQKDMTAPLFFWNVKAEDMTEAKVREIVRESYLQSGYNGFGILGDFKSTGNYFMFEDEKFFTLYGAALDEATKYGMKCALYDEDGWPSGWAG